MIIDFPVGDQRQTIAAEQRLIAGNQIDDGEAAMDQSHIRLTIESLSVGPAMAEGGAEGFQNRPVGRLAGAGHQPGDPAHQAAIRSKKAQYWATTAASV